MLKKLFIPIALLLAVLGTSYAITVPAWWMIGQSATDQGTASFTVPITTSQTLGVTGKTTTGTLESGAATFTDRICVFGTKGLHCKTSSIGYSSPFSHWFGSNFDADTNAKYSNGSTSLTLRLNPAGTLDLYRSDAGSSNYAQHGPYTVWHGGMTSYLMPRNSTFYLNTSDGSDDGYMLICAGGAVATTRGAYIALEGNEQADNAGRVILSAGNVASGSIDMQVANGVLRLRVMNSGDVRLPAFAAGGTTGASLDNDGDIIRTPSDLRLKEDITDITAGLDKVRAMRGVTFNWKDKQSYGSRRDYGMIAQEVEAVIPEVVTQNPDGMKSLDYQKIVPVLVEAIKDQQRIIESLESRINALEGK